jgi:hypothetical protein
VVILDLRKMESADLIINFNEYLIINYDKKGVDLIYNVNKGVIKVNYVIKIKMQ